MGQNSIKGRLIAIVVLSQALLAVGLLFAGVFYARERQLSMLDAGMQARAMSIAALVRYTEDASGNVYFDDSLVPRSLDPAHPDFFAVWTERSGLLTRSANWPTGSMYCQSLASIEYSARLIGEKPSMARKVTWT